MRLIKMLPLAALSLALTGCALASGGTDGADTGIVIYYGKMTLNEQTFDIIAERAVQLRALVVPSGDAIAWSSSNPNGVTVNETGRIRASKTSGRSATITATSQVNPAIKSHVTFRVVDQR